MASMRDNVRAWWNSTADNLGDPGKLAQLSVADLEKSIRSAKESAASVIGRPAVLEGKLKDMKETDEELSAKILALLQSGEEGKLAAVKYVERQVEVRKQLTDLQEEYDDAKEASTEWQDKIRYLENELYSRRNEADKIQAQYETAKAEQSLGKQMQNVDSILGSDDFGSIKAKVEKEQAKAAGFSAMSGMDSKVDDAKLIKNAQTDSLMDEYMKKMNENK